MAEHAFSIAPEVDVETFHESVGLGLYLVYEGEEADGFTVRIDQCTETGDVWVLVEHEDEDAIRMFFLRYLELMSRWDEITDRDVTIAHARWCIAKMSDAAEPRYIT